MKGILYSTIFKKGPNYSTQSEITGVPNVFWISSLVLNKAVNKYDPVSAYIFGLWFYVVTINGEKMFTAKFCMIWSRWGGDKENSGSHYHIECCHT